MFEVAVRHKSHFLKIDQCRQNLSCDSEISMLRSSINYISSESLFFSDFIYGTVSGSGTGPLDYGATGPVPDL